MPFSTHLCCITSLFYFLPNVLNLLPGFNTTKYNQRRPLPRFGFLSPSIESPAIELFIFIAVFAPHTKNLPAYYTDNDAAAATAYPVFIWGVSTLCSYGHFPIVPSIRSFCKDFNFWGGRVTTVMSVSAALVYWFIPLMQLHISHSIIGHTSRFTSVSFGYTHDFTILYNSHEVFSSQQKIGPRIEGSMTTIGIYVIVFYMSCTKSS